MRSKFFMLACAAMLTATVPAQAVLTLEWWSGPTQASAFNATTSGTPSSLVGLRNYNFVNSGGNSGIAKLTGPLNMNVGDSRIISLVLRDTDVGSGFTLDQWGLQTYAVSFGYMPGVLEGFRDTNGGDGMATTVTVGNQGGNNNGSATNPGNSQENAPFAVSNFDASHFTVGNLFFPVFSGFDEGGNGTDNLYKLANILVTATGPGAGALTMSKPTTPPPTFGSTDNQPAIVSYDSEVWGVSGNTVYSLPFTVVPEPSSMVLAGLAVSGLGYRLRRKFRGEKATA
jgi:hypothetical protein